MVHLDGLHWHEYRAASDASESGQTLLIGQLVVRYDRIYPALLDQQAKLFRQRFRRANNDSVSYPIQLYKSQRRG
jgi:hypothetical protein